MGKFRMAKSVNGQIKDQWRCEKNVLEGSTIRSPKALTKARATKKPPPKPHKEPTVPDMLEEEYSAATDTTAASTTTTATTTKNDYMDRNFYSARLRAMPKGYFTMGCRLGVHKSIATKGLGCETYAAFHIREGINAQRTNVLLQMRR